MERSKNQLSHDPLYSVYLLGFEYPNFVHEYRASFGAQNNLLFLVSQPLLEKLNRLLKPPAGVYSKLVEVYYDTTFQLGHFYLSTICFRHYMLSGRPTIPCAFLLHQRKFLKDHLSFLEVVGDICPNLRESQFAFISDREFKDVSRIFKNALHCFCWNHIQSDVRFWSNSVRHRGAAYQHKDSSRTYVKDVKELLLCGSVQEFGQKIESMKPMWADGFIAYFNEHLENDLRSKACRFAVGHSGLCDEWSGITSNAAESMNAVLKRTIDHPISMPEAVIITQNLTNYYDYEIDCGMCGTGKYPINEQFGRYKENVLDLRRRDSPIELTNIVDFVKQKANMVQLASAVTGQHSAQVDQTNPGKMDDSSEEAMAKVFNIPKGTTIQEMEEFFKDGQKYKNTFQECCFLASMVPYPKYETALATYLSENDALSARDDLDNKVVGKNRVVVKCAKK